MKKLVVIENVHKKYAGKEIWTDLSLSIYENKCIALLGGNGVGKSTLLRCIAGIERPNSGRISYQKEAIKIGYVPERFPKDIRFTPSEYLTYIGKIGGVNKTYVSKRIASLLELFGLDGVDNWVRDLSKGNVQKVGLLQAILQNPDLLILDEPISGLDVHTQNVLLKILKELKNNGTTIILTYHEANVLEAIVDDIYVLQNQSLQMYDKNKLNVNHYKLIEVKHLDCAVVKEWNEVSHVEEKEDALFLSVPLHNSDLVIERVLQLKGSIDTVTNQEQYGN